MKFQYIFSALLLTLSAFSLNAQENKKNEIEITGWVQSPFLKEKRVFKKSESKGVKWFLERLEKYEKPKKEKPWPSSSEVVLGVSEDGDEPRSRL